MVSQKNIERWVLFCIGLTLFVGLWHGFPITNVVADEGFFSGAVLRALEAHSILPLPLDVPYGTITYYISYVVIGLGLLVMWPFFGFNIAALKSFIIQNPWIVYGLARLVSFALAIICLLAIYKALRRYVEDYRTRLVIIVSLFGTLLVNVIFHTSKVWILSTVLMLASFYCLVRALEGIDTPQTETQKKKWIWGSVITAFLSFANFPFMGMSLITLPILLFYFWKDTKCRKLIIVSTSIGALLFLLIVASNFSGIKAQVYSIIFDYSFSEGAKIHNVSLLTSVALHLKKIVLMFPVLLMMLFYCVWKGKVQCRRLFVSSLIYIAVYVVLIIIVDRWSTNDKEGVRYLFPVPFLLMTLIASYRVDWKKIFLIPAIITIIFIVPTIYFLSIETTSHRAISYVREKFGNSDDVVFINHVGADTPIPQNKASYLLSKEVECGTKCQITIEKDLEKDFKPLSLDNHTDPVKLKKALEHADVYFVERAVSTSTNMLLVDSFTNPIDDLNFYSLDNTGSYFDLNYFGIKQYGPNIYIYRQQNQRKVVR